jgi:protein O-mannosyl-transferase
LNRKNIYLLSLVAGLTILAYSNILFNFFLGDDFVHLTWLSKAVHDPSLLLRNFTHNWLDIQTFRFYRPFISVVMFTDYVIWGANGLGFHITNVLYHTVSTMLVFGITKQLAGTSSKRDSTFDYVWPAAAALLFGLYPLHCEPVSWITGRVDTIVTTFYLAAVWCYIRWRNGSSILLLAGSLASITLALLSKEMAVSIPALLVAYELIFSPKSNPSGRSNISLWVSRLVDSIKVTAPYWVLLVLYFSVRRFALGTFVGGYDDSLFFVANWKEFIRGWCNGLFMMFVPANRLVIGGRNVIRIAWDIGMMAAISGLVFSIFKGSRSVLLFLFTWWILGLAPVYKVFAILPDLEGSRLAYVATVPLTMLLAYGLCCAIASAAAAKQMIPQRLAEGSLLLLLVCAYLLLFLNNEVWRRAGTEMNAIRASLQKTYEQTTGDPQTLLIGMPDEVNGAYLGRNAIPGMLEQPQFSRDIRNCVFFNDALPIMPFGFLKESLKNSADQVKIYFWNRPNKAWQKVNLADASKNANPKVNLQKPTSPSPRHPELGVEATLATSGDLLVKTENGTPASCFNSDFLFVTKKNSPTNVTLEFKNALSLRGKVVDNITGQDFNWRGSDGMIFCLRADPIWSLGGSAHAISLKTKDESALLTAQFIPAEQLMPFITFANSGYLGTKGYLHLSPATSSGTVSCYKNEVPGATGFCLEIMLANAFLSPADLNATHPSQTHRVWKEIIKQSKTGEVVFNRDFFPTPGIYQARAWALDSNGKRVGVAGDHIDISVD